MKDCATNIRAFKALWALADRIGMPRIGRMVATRDALQTQTLLLEIIDSAARSVGLAARRSPPPRGCP